MNLGPPTFFASTASIIAKGAQRLAKILGKHHGSWGWFRLCGREIRKSRVSTERFLTRRHNKLPKVLILPYSYQMCVALIAIDLASSPTCMTSSNFKGGPVPPNPPGPTRANSPTTAMGGGMNPAAPCSSQVVGADVMELMSRSREEMGRELCVRGTFENGMWRHARK